MRSARSIAAILLAAVVGAPMAMAIGGPPPPVAATGTSAYVAAGPHRLADTRAAECGCQRIDDRTIRVQIAGRFGIPASVTAAAITVTSTRVAADGFVSAHPAGSPAPNTSIVNPRAGRDVANSSIVAVGADGAIDVRSNLVIGAEVDLIVDVTGAFQPVGRTRAGRFVPVPATRLFDTRAAGAPASGPPPGTIHRIALPELVASDARSIVVNVTTVGGLRPGYFSVRPADRGGTATSFMNTDGSGRPLAASIIAPVSADGVVIETTAGGHLIVDLVGWFTGESARRSGNGLFVVVPPTRLVDTRTDAPRLWPAGTREVAVGVGASAVATNITIDRSDHSGFVTAYPAGTARPATSTINASGRDDTIANFAITSISDRGAAYFSDRGTDLIVDLTGYFSGTATAAALPTPPNVEPPTRTFLVGDSTLAAVRWYGTTEALLGYPYVLSAESCRRLAVPSCRGREGYVPTNTVTAINQASGSFDLVVVMAGYDDWWTTFPSGFDQVVAAARAKGARTIIWLTYREGVGYIAPGGVFGDEAFVRNNQTLREKVASGDFPDVVLADWHTYAEATSGWLASDGIHLSLAGSYGVADYISRFLAHLGRRPCPMPRVAGGPIDSPCPNPDTHAPIADIRSLYP